MTDGQSEVGESLEMDKPRSLYEIAAYVRYQIVVAADSSEQALAHVESWGQAWGALADFIDVSDVEVVDERMGLLEEAHVIIDSERT